jgi:hypothetical protein
MNHSIRRINALARQLRAERYLEIGVSGGETFRDVEIDEKTGVDPSFGFDTSQFANDSTRFIASTSDQFFMTEASEPAFDIVFIDGLHTFEQVVRDLSNTIIRTHKKSVILLDDTVPDDVYSAIPDQKAAVGYRKAAGGNRTAWQGDVFKAVFYIHDFWPMLNFRTITNLGNPQTIVWRSNEFRRTPLFNNLESISRLSYFDLQKYRGAMQSTTEEAAIRLCVSELCAA